MWDLAEISPMAAPTPGWPGVQHHFRLCAEAIRVMAAMRTVTGQAATSPLSQSLPNTVVPYRVPSLSGSDTTAAATTSQWHSSSGEAMAWQHGDVNCHSNLSTSDSDHNMTNTHASLVCQVGRF